MAQAQNPRAKTPAAAKDVPKILRIGIRLNDALVDEKLIRKRDSVTIGQSSKNTFVLPASNSLPRSFTLFEITPTGYVLNFVDSMDGRISIGSQLLALGQLRQQGAQKKGANWHIPLPANCDRGKVTIGDVTVLFQFVAPPPEHPRPQLPASVRSSLLQNLDWMLVAVIAASFVLHFGFVVYLRNMDFPRKPDIEEIPDRFVKMLIPKKEEKKPEIAKVDDKAKKEEEKPKAKATGDKKPAEKKPVDPEAAARAAAERRARLAEDVQKMGVLKILGARGEDGAVADLVGHGDVSGDADKVFASVGGVGVAGAGGTGLRSAKGAGGTGSLRGGGSLRASGPGEVGTGERGGEHAVHVVIKDSAPTDVDGSLDPSVIAKEIRGRLKALQACYESGLKRNPSIGGKLILRFEVSSIGKVTSAEVDQDNMHDDDVLACIKGRVMSWRFPAPPSGSVQFSFPFIFQASK